MAASNSLTPKVRERQTSTQDDDLFLGGKPAVSIAEREADEKVISAWLSLKGARSTLSELFEAC